MKKDPEKKNGEEGPLSGEEFSVRTEEEFEEKAAYIKEHLPAKIAKISRRLKLVGDVLILFRFMTDPEVHWAKKALAVAALLYFIIPLDAIPDFAPVIGYLDDIGVITLVVGYLAKSLRNYYPEEV